MNSVRRWHRNSVFAFSNALNLKHCCYMIVDVWDSLTEDSLRNAWKKLWTLPEEPEIEEERINLKEDDLDKFIDLFGSIPGFMDDAVDWLNHESKDSVYQILEHNDDSRSDGRVDAPNKPSPAEAFALFEMGLEWFPTISERITSTTEDNRYKQGA
ncbi:unnamed protein product [Hermetia illucens]|uniref:DDE-1 domain-containing protein n=1 Tax=Hermetia illucens TaxID=343691 RepID=A0A7R8YVN2_HERIL|nr:unnamed protein product [Hermetia illucens]